MTLLAGLADILEPAGLVTGEDHEDHGPLPRESTVVEERVSKLTALPAVGNVSFQ